MDLDRRSLLISGAGTVILAGCDKTAPISDKPLAGIPATLSLPAEPDPNKMSAPVAPRYIDQMGQSFDSVTDDKKRLLAVGKQTTTNVSPDPAYRQNSLQWDEVEDQSHYQARIRTSAKGRARYGIVSARGKGSSSKIEAKDSYSLSINCVGIRYSDAQVFEGNPSLDRDAAERCCQSNRNSSLTGAAVPWSRILSS